MTLFHTSRPQGLNSKPQCPKTPPFDSRAIKVSVRKQFVRFELFKGKYHLSHSTTKPAKRPVRPAKTQISLCIHPAWSVFAVRSVSSFGPRFLHVDSEDTDQTVWMSRLIWVFAGRTGYLEGFVARRPISEISYHAFEQIVAASTSTACCTCIYCECRWQMYAMWLWLAYLDRGLS